MTKLEIARISMANALLTQCANRDTTVGDIVEALKQYERMLKDPVAVGPENVLRRTRNDQSLVS